MSEAVTRTEHNSLKEMVQQNAESIGTLTQNVAAMTPVVNSVKAGVDALQVTASKQHRPIPAGTIIGIVTLVLMFIALFVSFSVATITIVGTVSWLALEPVKDDSTEALDNTQDNATAIAKLTATMDSTAAASAGWNSTQAGQINHLQEWLNGTGRELAIKVRNNTTLNDDNGQEIEKLWVQHNTGMLRELGAMQRLATEEATSSSLQNRADRTTVWDMITEIRNDLKAIARDRTTE